MAQIGSFALLLALACSVFSFVAGAMALVSKRAFAATLAETARRAGIATFAAVLLASVVLVICAFRDDFSIAYILHHSNRDLPGPYKFAVLWSGQEGSLLFWSLLLAAYGFVLRLRYKTDPRLFAYASVVLSGVQIFFLLLLQLRGASLCHRDRYHSRRRQWLESSAAISGDGDPSAHALSGVCRIHRAVAFALGALIMKYPGEKWIHITRRWTMVTWAFLTCGVFLGAHWA